MNKIIVKQNEENPVPIEVIADSIKAISEGIKKLRSGPLNDTALILLIKNAAPSLGKGYQTISLRNCEIEAVLEGIESLEKTYLKPKKKVGSE